MSTNTESSAKKSAVSPRYTEQAIREKEHLRVLNKQPLWPRTLGYCKLSGPAFMEAALTLGAGSFATSITLGAAYGYQMLWAPFYCYLFGLFMLALATRFVTATDVPIIEAQNKYHGRFFGSFATAFVGCFMAAMFFSFGQYALGADATTAMLSLVGLTIPKELSWIIIFAISAPLALMYGRGNNVKYVKIVENAMKILILVMILVFAAIIFTTGVNIPAMVQGLLIPRVDPGVEGITMVIASMTAVIGVIDWVLFHNGMEARGFSEEHERLGRFDSIFGGLIPVTVVLSLVTIAFAEAFSGKPGVPSDSTELANALVAVLPSIWVQIGFYVGVIALVISTMVGLSTVCVTSFCQMFGLEKDSGKWWWPILVLAPHIGLFGAFLGKPVMVVVTVSALNSLLNWVSGNSWYLLANDVRYLGRRVVQSRFFNLGILFSITILNVVFITFVLSKIGAWPA